MKNPLPYLKFQWKASNRHGIHPPFVYHLLEDVIYSKEKNQKNSPSKRRHKEYQLYKRLFRHFKVKSIFLNHDDTFFEQLINDVQITKNEIVTENQSLSLLNQRTFDVYILNQVHHTEGLSRIFKKTIIKNDSFVIIPQLRASKSQLDFWRSFIKEDFVQVSLEFYSFGLVFFRKECSRQSFSIRF